MSKEKGESIDAMRQKAGVWEEQVSGMPTHDELWVTLEEATRKVGAGLVLEGFNVTQISESGNGVEAYPYFVIEPIIDKEQWEYYMKLLEIPQDMRSEPQQQFCVEMKTAIDEARTLTQEKLEALLASYYVGEHAKDVEGVAQLVVSRNPEGIVVVAPNGAHVDHPEAAEQAIMDDEERKQRDVLFRSEMEHFAKFLRLHYVGQ